MSNGIHLGAIRKIFHDITDVNSISLKLLPKLLPSIIPFQLGRDAARPIVDFLAILSSSLLSFCSYRRRRVPNIWWAGPATHLQYQSLVICLLFRRTLPARGLRILGSQRSMVCHMFSSITELAVDFTISSYCAPPRPRHCARASQFCVFSAHISRNCYHYCATLRWELMLFSFVFGDLYVISSVLFATQGYWFSVFEFLLVLLSIFPRSIGMCESQRLRPSTPPTPWRHVRG